MTLLNIPAVLDTPYASELRQRVDLGFYGMQFTYLNPLDPAPVDFSFRMTIYHENDRVLSVTSLPTAYAPGTYLYSTFDEDPEIDFALTFQDLLDQMSSRFRAILIRTGMLPEGRYRIEMEPVADTGGPFVATIPGLAEFEVRYPAPPIPLFPTDGGTVSSQPATFSWTPVLGFPGDLYEYELLLVEVEPAQTPLQALLSNRPHTDEPVVTTSTTFTLTADYPPLDAGSVYVYQITARELNRGVPLADEGRSEIVAFTFGSLDGPIVLVQPADGAVVDEEPTFTWTTTAAADHELSIYPIPPSTSPDEAVAGTESVVQTDVTGFIGYAYDGPPLDPGTDYAWLIRLLHPATGEVIGQSAVATFQAEDSETIPPVIAQTGSMMDVLWPVLGELSSSFPPPIQVHFPDLDDEATLVISSPTLGVVELNADDFDAADEAIIDPTVWAGAASLPPPVAGTLYEWDDFSTRVVVDEAFTADPAPFGIAFVYTKPHVTALSPVNAEPVTSHPPPIELHVDGATPGMMLVVTSSELGVREIEGFDEAGNVVIDPAGWGAFDGPPPVPDSVYNWELGARIVSHGGVGTRENVPISFTYTGALVLGRPRLVRPGVPAMPLPDSVSDVSTFAWDGIAIPAHASQALADDVVYRVFLIEMDGGTWQAPYEAPPIAQVQLASEPGRTRWSHTFDEVDWQPGQTYGWYVQARDLGPSRLPIMEEGFSEVFTFVYAPDASDLPLAQFEVVSPTGGEAVFDYPPPIRLRYPDLPGDATLLITSPTLGVIEIAASAFDASDEYVVPGSTWLTALEEPPVVGRRYDWDDFVLRVIADSSLSAPTPFEASVTYQGALTLGRPSLVAPGDNTMDLATIAAPPDFAWTGVQVPDGSPPTLADAVAYRLVVTEWDRPIPPPPGDTTAHDLVPVAQVQLPTEAGRSDWNHTFSDDEITWQPGQAYAWYVRAVDLAASPAAIMNEGYSYTNAFVYDPDGFYASGDDGLASGYAVIEDIAWVRDDGELAVDSLDDGSMALDGPGTLVLDFTPADDPSVGPLVTLPVETTGLTFPAATNGHPPLASAGRMDGTGQGLDWPFGAFTLSGLAWDPLGGLQLSGRHGLPVAGTADTGAESGDAPDLPQDTLSAPGASSRPANPIAVPPCLAGQLFDVTFGDFAEGVFEAALPATVIGEPGCEMAFGGAGSLWITDLGGVIEGDLMATDGDAVSARTTLGGYFALGDAFQCPQGADLDLGTTMLTLHHTGLLEGAITGLAPQCEFPIGPFVAETRQSDLLFGADGDRQTARLELEAAIQLGDTLSVAGQAAFDLMTGGLDTYRFFLEDPFTFYVPDEAQPALAFRIDQAELSEAGLLIDGLQELDLGPETAAVTFDELVLDVPTMQVVSGEATFAEAIGFKLTIDETTFGLTFSAVPGDADLGADAGALVRLAAGARLDANGLAIQGEADAQLNYGAWSLDSLTVDFSDDFAFGLAPFQIATGRMDFYLGDQRIAFADALGFHPDISFFLLAALPGQLPLPHLDVAYLVLKDAAGNLLVDVETGEGTTTISTRDGAPIDFVVPLFQGDALTPPTVPVSFSELTLDASLNVTQRGIAVSVGGDPQFDLPGLGIPLTLTDLAYEVRGGLRALHLDGLLHLLDQPTDCPTSFAVQSNAIVEGSVTCPGLTAEVPLAAPGTSLLLDVQAVHGSVALAPLQPALTTFFLALDAHIELRSATDLLAGASVVATLDENGFRVDEYQPTGGSPQLVDLGPAALRFDGMTSFFLEYDFDAGWDFLIGLDMAMRVGFDGAQAVMLPLRGTEISPDGVSIPAQIMNDATDPAVPETPLDAGPAVVTLLEVETDPILLTLDGLALAEPFIPTFDLAVSLPGLAGVSPELAAASFTIEDATVEEGFVEGTLVPYVFVGDGAYVGFGDAAGLYLTSVEGSLGRGTLLDGTPVQDYALALAATPHLGGTLGSDGTMTWATDQAAAALALSREALRGTITDIGGSGQLSGNTALSVANGTIEIEQIYTEVPRPAGRVDLDVADQKLEVAGEVVLAIALGAVSVDAAVLTASVLPENVVRATGTAAIDLLAGTLSADSELVAEGLQLAYPVGQAEPLFGFEIDAVTLTGADIVLDGMGLLDAAGTAAEVAFDGFTLGYDGTLAGGTAAIQDAIGFQLDFPSDWSLMAPVQPPTLSDGVWFSFPGATLGVDGIMLDGTGGAGLYLGGTPYDDLEVGYTGLTLTFPASGPPVIVASGRADFNIEQGDGSAQRLAYLDADGFHLDNLLAALDLPDRLGLPTVDVAYLEVRDPLTGADLVETAAVAGGTEVRTVGNQTVRLVLPGFDDGGASLALDVAFNLTVDDAFAVTGGVLDVDLSTQPLSMETYGFPLDLLGLHFDADAGSAALTAGARLRLPASLGDLDVDLIELTFGPDGFEYGRVNTGTYAASCPASPPSPIATAYLGNGALTIDVGGVELVFGASEAFSFSGTLTSDLFAPDDAPGTAHVCYAAEFTPQGWAFFADASNLMNGEVPLGVARLELNPVDGLLVEVTETDFEVHLNGTLYADELLGASFALSVDELRVGTSGVVLDASTVSGQTIPLFDGIAEMELTQAQVTYAASVLTFDLDGELSIFDRNDITFTGLRFGTGGTLSVNDVDLLPGSQEIAIIPEIFVFDDLRLAVDDGTLALTAGGAATLPAPVDTDAAVNFTLATDGSFDIDGPAFVFDTGYQIGNNPETEFGLGSLATLDLTGVGVDLGFGPAGLDGRRPLEAALLAAFAVYFENDTENRVTFGTATDLLNRPGFIAGTDGTVQWSNVLLTGEVGYETDFFHIAVTSARSLDGRFGLELDGEAGLKLEGVSGSGALDNTIVSELGLEYLGDFGGATFALENVFSLEVGTFQEGSGNIQITEGNDDPNNPEAETETIQTERYLLFTGGNNGGDALRLTLDKMGASGGVGDVIYYKKPNGGGVFLSIRDASFSLAPGGSGSTVSTGITATFNYETDGASGFALRVGGAATIGAVGGALTGTISTLNDEFSAGLFVAFNAPIPILPGIVELTGAGGGFFVNPARADRDIVLSALATLDTNLGDFADDHADAPFNADHFMVMLYARAGLIGTGGAYLINGSAYLELTDASFTIYGYGGMIEQMIETEFDLSVGWGGNVTSIEGSSRVAADFGVLASAEASADFAYYKETGEDAIWAITLSADADMLNMLTLDSEAIIAPAGFYAEIEVVSGFDIAIVSFQTSMGGSFWVYTDGDFGVWGEATIEASVLFGAAKIGGGLEAALIKSGSTDFLYGALTGYVSIIGFKGDVTFWIAVEDGDVGFGEGENPEFDALIAEARQEAEEMVEEAEAIVAAIEEMELITFSDEQLATAGAYIMTADGWAQLGFSLDAVGNEFQIAGSQHQIQILYDQANAIQSAPGPSNHEDALDDFLAGLAAIDADAGAVIDRLNSIEATAIAFTAASSDLFDDFPAGTPVQRAQLGWDACQPIRPACAPGFAVDDSKAQAQSDVLGAHRTEIQALDAAYAEAIVAVEDNLATIDDLMASRSSISGITLSQAGALTARQFVVPAAGTPSVNGVAEDYTDVLEDASAYFAQHLGYLWSLEDWAEAHRTIFDDREGAIRSTMEDVRTIYENSRDYELAKEVIEERWRIIKKLELLAEGAALDDAIAEAEDQAEQWSDDANLQGIVTLLHNLHVLLDVPGQLPSLVDSWEDQLDDARDDLYTVFEDSGMDLWYGVPAGGADLILDEVPGRVDEVVAAQPGTLGALMTAHRNLTAGIDAIYASKAKLLADLYGLYEIYATWRAGTLGDGTDDVLRDQQAVVAQQLEAPVLQDISVSPVQEGYHTRGDLSWTATHPAGTIEHALMIADGSGVDLSTSAAPVSVGDRTSFRQYAAREGDELISMPWGGGTGTIQKHFTATIRSRGEGGVAASRVASYHLVINADGSTTGSSGSTGPVLAEDTTPPSMPMVTLPYPLGQNGLSHWSPSLAELDVELTATDAESDVVQFEVALSTTLVGTNVLDWTTVYGTWAGGNDVSGTRTLEATLRGLSLEAGTAYFVHARATNGEGLVSPIRYKLLPVTIDPTAPTWDVAAAAPQWQDVSASNGSQFAHGNNAVAPLAPTPGVAPYVQMTDPPQREDTTEEPAAVEVTWSALASDVESGMMHYEYVVLPGSGASTPFSGLYPIHANGEEEPPFTIQTDAVNYADAFYLYVRAVNHAGTPGGDVLEVGPIELTDPSKPSTPGLKAQASADGVYLFVTKLSDDQESDVLGYRYAIGTTPGGTDVVPARDVGVDVDQPAVVDPNAAPVLLVRTLQVSHDAPDHDTGPIGPDLPGGPLGTNGSTLPDLPTLSALPTGQDLYVQIRAVNADGLTSAHSQYVGPFRLDITPPDPFSITVTYDTDTCTGVNVTASNVRDGETGILRVEYEIEDAANGASIRDWATLPYDPPGQTNSFALYTYDECWPVSPNADRIRVTVRAENTLGLVTESATVLSPYLTTYTTPVLLGGP